MGIASQPFAPGPAALDRRPIGSKWIAEQITKAVKDQPTESFLQAAGAGPDFPALEEIRRGYGEDSPREAL